MKESSRLIVKNLPKSMDDKRLKHFFESKGYVITDCHVMTTKQGASRMFAFLGTSIDLSINIYRFKK